SCCSGVKLAWWRINGRSGPGPSPPYVIIIGGPPRPPGGGPPGPPGGGAGTITSNCGGSASAWSGSPPRAAPHHNPKAAIQIAILALRFTVISFFSVHRSEEERGSVVAAVGADEALCGAGRADPQRTLDLSCLGHR